MLKRSFLLFFALLLLSNNMQAQSRSNCTDDSTYYRPLLVHLDTCKINQFDAFDVYDRFFEPKLKDSCLCNLLMYVRVFEYLLDNGLDLNYSFFKNTPYINSTNLPEDAEMTSNRRKNVLFYAYLVFKLKYDEHLMAQYEKEKGRSLNQDVTSILKYNIYSRPTTLERILTLKNGKAQSEKYEKEVEMIMGKD